ncbi:MAG TPA: hypothetical protein QF753_04580 [Victivallales bacterium]|nr:hypothetical protein [Victivallales bacterium]
MVAIGIILCVIFAVMTLVIWNHGKESNNLKAEANRLLREANELRKTVSK